MSDLGTQLNLMVRMALCHWELHSRIAENKMGIAVLSISIGRMFRLRRK